MAASDGTATTHARASPRRLASPVGTATSMATKNTTGDNEAARLAERNRSTFACCTRSRRGTMPAYHRAGSYQIGLVPVAPGITPTPGNSESTAGARVAGGISTDEGETR